MWGHLGKMLWREGEELSVLTRFYCTVRQVLLLFGDDTWVLLAPMAQRIEVFYMGLLR